MYQKEWTRAPNNLRRYRKAGKNYTRVPIEEKESYKWIEGVNRACANTDQTRLVDI